MKTKSNTLNLLSLEKRMFYLLFGSVLVLLFAYLFLMQRSVFNIVAKNAAEREIAALSTEVASLEAEYLALSSAQINADYAETLGFRDAAAEQGYAAVPGKAATLTLRNEI